jgi:lipopolysaccharide transport system ATP-binding protein
MSDIAISASNLGKQYDIGARADGNYRYKAMRDVLTDLARKPFRLARRIAHGKPASEVTKRNLFWALKDLNFDIRHGEVVGVIGRNGAGKSTLLKILSRVTEPTEGRVRIWGRVGSLLEVGTGFHPELSGRDNIFMNGAILGMRREEIARKFDEMVAFAEVEKFIDMPVKRYSSGMYLRLAFAVAAHLEPEILLVDEVLAVGDAAFQKKCLGKMGEVSQHGRTILFVSHNMTALRNLCTRAIWLSDGQVVEDGEASSVVNHYLQENASSHHESLWPDPATAPGNDKVRLHRVRVLPELDEGTDRITVRTPLKLEFCYWNFVPDALLNVSFFLYSLEEICVFVVASNASKRPVGLMRDVCEVPGNLLNDGNYYVRVMIVKDGSASIFVHPNAVAFEVDDVERRGAWFGKWPGAVRPAFRWESDILEIGPPAHHGEPGLDDAPPLQHVARDRSR